jgi:peptidyl-prolyl cis-trans isomerase A (cyclophilin A)
VKTLLLISAAACALAACGGGDSAATPNSLINPDTAAMKRAAPDSFDVAFETGKGPFVVRAYRTWAPLGVDRFHYLVTNHYYDGVKFFRNIDDFMVQFGIHGEPAVNNAWRGLTIPGDSVRASNTEGMVTYAMGQSPDTRTVQLFINKANNSQLDGMGFAPIGKVISGMDVVMKLYSGYGEGAPRGAGPEQGRLQREGNRYLNTYFPQLDSIVTARIK